MGWSPGHKFIRFTHDPARRDALLLCVEWQDVTGQKDLEPMGEFVDRARKALASGTLDGEMRTAYRTYGLDALPD